MNFLGFGSKSRKWMSCCFSIACFSILINGSPYGFFDSSRGLCQGTISCLSISHLLFADDTLIMCDADHDQIYNLGHILLSFEEILGLKVNLRKFEIVAMGGGTTSRRTS
jgi:hypothetical protein